MTPLTTGTDSQRSSRKGMAGLVLVAAVLGATAAQAQGGAQDRATAEILFQDGKKLMNAGKVPEACAKLEESQRIDPRAGTLLVLAVCHQKLGKVASAWVEFREAMALAKAAGRTDRVALAKKEIAALEPKLPRLAVEVPQSVVVPGLTVRRDGEELGKQTWGTAVPVDPGEHVVVAKAPDHQDWQTKFSIDLGEQKKVEVPPLVPVPKPVPVASSSAPIAPKPPSKTGAWIVGGVGVLALGVGTYFGIRAISKRHSSDDHCHGSLCDPAGVELNNQAKTAATVSNIAIGVGVLGVGIATWMLLSGSSRTETPSSNATVQVLPMPAPRGAAIVVQSTW